MTSELTDLDQAFAPLDQRRTANGAPDRISLRDYVTRADIGAFGEERGAPQRLRFNVVVEVAGAAGPGDDVDAILSYDALGDAIHAALADERLNLLETLAERIAGRILAHGAAQRCYLRVEKLDRGPGDLGVEIMRDQCDLVQDDAPAAVVAAPLVVYLAPAALEAPLLAGWMDELAGLNRPAIVVAGAALQGEVHSPAPEAQRRIDLLTLDQAAWRLAGRDTRCLVVATRTEMDWALGQGRLCVWAPSKMVLDAVPRPDVESCAPPVLARWLAEQTGAARIVVVGADLPPGGVAITRRALSDARLLEDES